MPLLDANWEVWFEERLNMLLNKLDNIDIGRYNDKDLGDKLINFTHSLTAW